MEENHGTAPIPGWYTEFLGAVIRQLPREIDPQIASGWIQNQEVLKKALREALLPGRKPYPLFVDYKRSVEDSVNAGHYNWFNPDITSHHFPSGRVGKMKVAVELISFGRNISTDDAHREIDRMGYRPANLNELLAFGEKYPDVQREFPVVALGSVWQHLHSDLYVPYLDRNGSERDLNLYWIENDWNGVCRFAAVRK